MDHVAGVHRRRPLPRWVLPGAAVALIAVVLTVVLVVRAAGSPACAATAPGGQPGRATYFDGSKGGNCSFGPPSTDLYVALSPTEYAAGAQCGGYLDVTGPNGTARVKIVDQCPECEAGHLDLSRAAFARIGNVSDGIIPISFHPVRDPQLTGTLQIKVKDGANPYWLAVLADRHGNPLAKVELRTGRGWVALQHTDYNYWIAAGGAGRGPFTLRLTDLYGHQATAAGITLSPTKVQSTSVYMYGAAPTSRAPTASAPPSYGPSKSPSTASPTGRVSSPSPPSTHHAAAPPPRCGR